MSVSNGLLMGKKWSGNAERSREAGEREQKIDVSSTKVEKKHAGSMSKICSKRPIIRETCAAVWSAKMKPRT